MNMISSQLSTLNSPLCLKVFFNQLCAASAPQSTPARRARVEETMMQHVEALGRQGGKETGKGGTLPVALGVAGISADSPARPGA